MTSFSSSVLDHGDFPSKRSNTPAKNETPSTRPTPKHHTTLVTQKMRYRLRMGLTEKDWILDPGGCPGFESHEVTSHLQEGPQIHHTEYLYVVIPKRYGLVNITDYVQQALKRSGVRDGFCFVSAMHITAGVYINDAESGLLSDISKWIDSLAPYGKDYRHHQTGEDNGDAHLKSYLTNHALTAPVTNGKIDFGTWQQIFYAEFDGRRKKRILVKIVGI